MDVKFHNILFLDIETVPKYASWDEVPLEEQELFASKTMYQRKDSAPEEFYEKAGIWAEFGKIICISVAYFNKVDNKLRVTSFANQNEKDLLIAFKKLIDTYFSKKEHLLCAHNGKEFDYPFIARRMLINRIELPKKLTIFGKKPWEIPHLDTLDLWKFGDYKHYTSLKLLTHILGLPSPKNDIDGSEVYDVYYHQKDLNRIINYCESDTIAVAQVFLRLQNLDPLTENNIVKI